MKFYSLFLGDWAGTQLSPDSLERKGEIYQSGNVWAPSILAGGLLQLWLFSKWSSLPHHLVALSIMCPLDLFPCDIPYSGVILHQKTACNSTSSYYVPVLCYTVSVLCGCQDEHPTHSIGTPTTLSVVEKMVS